MGIIRLFLALVVVIDHLAAFELRPNQLYFTGYYKLGLSAPSAVMLFYVISGFLISTALSQKYPAGLRGTQDFYKSRIVRIFSLYWPLLLLLIILNGDNARTILQSVPTAFCGLTLIGSDWVLAFASYPIDDYRCFPYQMSQAWTLGAELTFYALAPWLLRHQRAALLVLLGSLALRVSLLATIGHSNTWTYHFFPATVCFFLLGHFARMMFDHWRPPAWLSFGFMAGCISFSLSSATIIEWDNPYFYAATTCFVAGLPGVFDVTRSSRFLNWLGALSFPVYLIHTGLIYFAFNAASPLSFTGEALLSFGKGFADPMTGAQATTAVFCTIVIIVAIVAHHAIEVPLSHVLQAMLRNKQAKLWASSPPAC